MNPVVTRMHAVSAAGRGVDALVDALAAGVPLKRPVPWEAVRSPFAALADVESAQALLAEVVGAVAVEGCGLVAATTSGDISGPFERWHRHGGEERAWRQDPARRLGLSPCTTVSVACASGAAAFEVARGWLRAGVCRRVVVAGYDALSCYIHAGFAGLGALAAHSCRPFHDDRDGLVLGEGAAALLLETPEAAAEAGREPLATLVGCGLAQDGVHLTAPDRTGAGLARALRAALGDVDPREVDAVSAHGTGTPFNDAMERLALTTVLGEAPPVHAAKGVLGHTLGAAGALEAVALVAMLNGAPVPAPPPGFSHRRDPRLGLSVNAAFGGIDTALLFERGRRLTLDPFQRRPATAVARHEVDADELPFARIFPSAPPALGRADTYVRAGIAALAGLPPLDPGTAVVLASETNCRAADLRYHAGLLAQGAAGASRIHFTYTIPGAPLAEAAILLGLKGPALVFCDGPERAHAEARRLVEEGTAPAAVALAVEAPEKHARAEATLYV